MSVSFDEMSSYFVLATQVVTHHRVTQDASSVLTQASVPPRVPLVTKLSVAWPGWRTLRLARAAQPRQPHPVSEPGSETSWEPGAGAELCPGYSLSLSPLSIPDTKPLWAWARYPPPPGSPRIFTFKSPIQRFAFKCFFSETQSPSDYLHTAGNWFSTASEVWRNISSRLAHFWLERSWALLAILTTQIRPGESIQIQNWKHTFWISYLYNMPFRLHYNFPSKIRCEEHYSSGRPIAMIMITLLIMITAMRSDWCQTGN